MSILRKKVEPVFSDAQTQELVKAIRSAESKTSGEIRVYAERRCKFVDAIDRAAEIFLGLEMEKTRLRNAVLFYIATDDKQVALYADRGIHEVADEEFWKETVTELVHNLKNNDLAESLCHAIHRTGDLLAAHFPYEPEIDKNELPDEIVFGH